MNVEVMQKAIDMASSDSIEEADKFLAEYYDEKTIRFGILRFNGNKEFRRRIRLAELAKDDYLAERYHACVPLLLSMLDGIVNDVSKHVGFFARSADMTAWDCIAAHETGLQTLAALMTKGRNKTNDEPIRTPYRNGILHGRELAFDNKIVAAKCWAALFAARDWALSISEGKKTPKPKKEISWRELFSKLAENKRQRRLLDAWNPRNDSDLKHLPCAGDPDKLPVGTPERAVAGFLENWRNQRYGLLAEAIVYLIETPIGKRARMAKNDFGNNIPVSYKIISVEDKAAARSDVIVNIVFMNGSTEDQILTTIRTIYQDDQNNPLGRFETGGTWKIVQNSFLEMLYPSPTKK